MPGRLDSSFDSRALCAPVAVVVFVLLAGLCDCVAVGRFTDTFLPPGIDPTRSWGERGDWSAVHGYEDNWRTALLRRATARLPDAAVVAAVIFAAHALLWTGVYSVGRALFAGSAWVALLGVVLVRIGPDLFDTNLLCAESPARMAAIGLAFWSIALTVRRRWVTACCAGGLIAHFSPTVACWFGQFIGVALFALNHERGWRRSAIGAACFLALSAGPLVRFLVGEILPDSPLPDKATLGLHFLADRTLSPFAVPLGSYVCLAVYLAMAFEWMKPHFRRATSPVAIIFFLIGMAGWAIEILFVGIVPVERAARFGLQAMRAFWLLWIPLYYAPVLAADVRNAWRAGRLWPAIWRGMIFSLPVLWCAWTLVERRLRAPRWNLALVILMLGLLALTVFVLPHDDQFAVRRITGPVFAVGLALLALAGTSTVWLVGRRNEARRAAGAIGLALVAFGVCFAAVAGDSAALAFAQAAQEMKRHAAWSAICHSEVVTASAPDSKWSVPWRPRQFRRWTGRAVLVNRYEMPPQVDGRLEWFRRYLETHEWPGAPPARQTPRSAETLERQLPAYRPYFGFGAVRFAGPSGDRLMLSPSSIREYGLHYAICERGMPPQSPGGGPLPPALVERIFAHGPFEVYKINAPGNGVDRGSRPIP